MKNLSLKSVREYLLFVFRYDYVMPKKKKLKGVQNREEEVERDGFVPAYLLFSY